MTPAGRGSTGALPGRIEGNELKKKRARKIIRTLEASPAFRRIEAIVEPYRARGLDVDEAIAQAISDGALTEVALEALRPLRPALVGLEGAR